MVPCSVKKFHDLHFAFETQRSLDNTNITCASAIQRHLATCPNLTSTTKRKFCRNITDALGISTIVVSIQG